jgi:hypothetical protein
MLRFLFRLPERPGTAGEEREEDEEEQQQAERGAQG